MKGNGAVDGDQRISDNRSIQNVDDEYATQDNVVSLFLRLLPLMILLTGAVVAVAMVVFKPEAERRPAGKPPALTVDVEPLQARNYGVVLESYGTIQPRTQTRLVAQVSGQIMHISANLREGGFFEKDEALLRIDQRDYQANVKIAEAALINARQQLAEEEARSLQAKADWQRLGNSGVAPDLVLRLPQLNAAKAQVESAKSSLQLAQLNLNRTTIRAPFAGRVLRQSVDVGQVVSAGTQIAEIYATDYVEVRLPLRDRDLKFMRLPETYVSDQSLPTNLPIVDLSSSLIEDSVWRGHVVRTESAIDESARQLHCVAQIDDPFGQSAQGRTPLKIGEYVTAKIKGNVVPNAIVVPVSSIYQSTFVYTVEDNLLQQQAVKIAWQNDDEAIIEAGLRAGQLLVLTPLGQVTSGLEVNIRERPGPGAQASNTAISDDATANDTNTRPDIVPNDAVTKELNKSSESP